ncbi:MAG: hypothetical protein JWN66_1234 [Sphingomonas bacterium]|uniref:hypothetical protein n=1 Tax=Sphingomonas bacterium TaxID=1895847 RepID=UPI002612CD9F|nr:hypothetical protein [Sphingomonas bacterium]MDB5704118.1 hypothetical protein [Sphingomonas bacterium]
MADELWGTFAVDDHLRARAYVAEVLLFDRLVIPEPHPDDQQQYQEWQDAGWRPDQLKTVIDRLGDRAIPVTWDASLRTAWKGEFAKLSPAARADKRMGMAEGSTFDFNSIRRYRDTPAKQLTRTVLVSQIRNAPYDWVESSADEKLVARVRKLDLDPAGTIEAVAGYASYPIFSAELGHHAPQEATAAAPDALLFGWDFIVPEDSQASNEKLLDLAIGISGHDEFRQSRREFHECRHKLIANGASAGQARAEMDRCLAILNKVTGKAVKNKRWQRALQLATVAAPLLDFPVPGLGMATGVALGVTSIWGEKLLPVPQAGPREKFAAIVHDSRKAFGWTKG